MKKIVCLILACLFSVGMLTACSSATVTGATTDPVKAVVPSVTLKKGETETAFTLIAAGSDTAFYGCELLETESTAAGAGVDAFFAVLSALSAETKIAMTDETAAYAVVWVDADKKEHTDFKFAVSSAESEKAAVLAVANGEAKYALVSSENAANLVKEVNEEKATSK